MNERLVIPIYLDTNTMLDLLASMEEGFTLAEKITTTSSEKELSESSIGAGFGISQIISFFKLDFGAQHKTSDASDQSKRYETERYHTYGSLLNKLRETLIKKNSGIVKIIKKADDWDNIEISDFIEIHGTFTPDPFITPINTLYDSLDAMKNLINEKMFANLPAKNGQPKDAKQIYKGLDASIQELKKTLTNMVKCIKGDDPISKKTQRYLVNLSNLPNHKVIVSLFPEYLRDRSGVELPNGKFFLLGKVVLTLKSNEQFSLVQNTPLAGITDKWIKHLITDRFTRLSESVRHEHAMFNIDELKSSIEGPLIKLIPISIYA